MSEMAAPPVCLAVVQIGKVAAPNRTLTERDALTLRARYVASLQALGSAWGAQEVVSSADLSARMSFEGSNGSALAQRAFQAARLLRERLLVDLDLTASLALHAAVRPAYEDPQRFREEVERTCERLLRHTPADTLVVSREVYLTLADADRRHLSPLLELEGAASVGAIFPAPAAGKQDSFPESRAERYREKFRGYLESSAVRRLRYVGFRLQRKEPPSLDLFDVFVVPKVEVRKLPDLTAEQLAQMPAELLVERGLKGATQALPKSLSFPQALQQYKSLVVLGDPGSGKTTLLKWLALLGMRGPLGTHEALGTAIDQMPLLVSVGRLAELRSTLGEAATVVDMMARYFLERQVDQDEVGLREFLGQMLRQGQCLVLLDGLDEVQSEAREGVMRWLETFASQYPANRFIASARQVGYVGLELSGAAEVMVGAFGDEQVRRYVHSFQRAYKAWEEGRPDDVTADQNATQLLEALFANQRLHELSRNPFILSSLALIHRAEGQLPRHRVQAYEIFARTLCETWGQARRIAEGGTEDEQLRYEEEAVPILGRLALEMHRQWPTGVAPERFIVEVLTKAIQERDGTSQEMASRSAHEFLKKAGEDVQILLERGAGQWGFLHLTFQEFFAAMGLHAAELFFEEGMTRLFQSRWEETLRLGVGYMALVQKRTEGVRRFIQSTLSHQEHGQRAYITQVLRKQIPLAVLFATEAGDTLPAALQDKLAEQFSEWLCSMPSFISEASFKDVLLSDFAARLSQPLTRLAGCEQSEVRARAISHLGKLKVSSAAPLIASALDDAAPAVRAAAAAASGGLRLVAVCDRLEALLVDPDAEVKRSAVSALAALRPEQMVKIVRSLMEQDSFETVIAMVEVLPLLTKDPEAASLVHELLVRWKKAKDPVLRSLVRLASVQVEMPESLPISAGSLPGSEQEELFDLLATLVGSFLSKREISTREVMLAFAEGKLPPAEYLSLKDPSQTGDMALARRLLPLLEPGEQMAVAVFLYFKRHPAGITAMVSLAQSPKAEVRQKALGILSLSRADELLPIFLEASKDSATEVRHLAAEGLRQWPSPESRSCLMALLNDLELMVRKSAAASLGSLKAEEAIEPLVQMASLSTGAERDEALKALWAIASA